MEPGCFHPAPAQSCRFDSPTLFTIWPRTERDLEQGSNTEGVLNQCVLNDGEIIKEPEVFLEQQTHFTDKEAEVPLGTVPRYGTSPSPDPVGPPPNLLSPPVRAQIPSHTFRAAP